jgi:predicted transcriptional regulator
MDFSHAALLGSCLSKDYAEGMFRLLMTYQNISASEAASRLNLHIKTVQDFLETLANLQVVSKEEVIEKKRPYYRYTLSTRQIKMDVDLNQLFDNNQPQGKLSTRIRERDNAGARFSVSRDNKYISNVSIWIGAGRERKERKINLSLPQGKFLFYLPFPSAEYETIGQILKKAGVSEDHLSEIIDIVDALVELNVIETDS